MLMSSCKMVNLIELWSAYADEQWVCCDVFAGRGGVCVSVFVQCEFVMGVDAETQVYVSSVLGVIPTIVFAPKLCVCPGVSDLQDCVMTWTEKG